MAAVDQLWSQYAPRKGRRCDHQQLPQVEAPKCQACIPTSHTQLLRTVSLSISWRSQSPISSQYPLLMHVSL